MKDDATARSGLTSLIGFNFSPSDEHILDFYLRRRIYDNNSASEFSFVIKEFDVYSTEPWNLPRDFFWYRNEESDIYFFTSRHPSSQNSRRANRLAGQGFWDVSTEDVVIKIGSEILGHKTALNFKLIEGGEEIESEWIMHEYRLSELKSTSTRETTFESFVLCKIHRKKSSSEEETEEMEEETEDGFVEEQRTVEEYKPLPQLSSLE